MGSSDVAPQGASRLAATPPAADERSAGGGVFRDLERRIREGVPKGEFLDAVDAARPIVYEALCDRYDDRYYAQLLYLKATNYLIARYHHACRHTRLTSHPVTLMVDPSNACQLHCPGCVHSSNEPFTRNLLWPRGTMRPAVFRDLLRAAGLFSVNTVLYNYGEPLLNKGLPEFLETAAGYAMSSSLSTNLSLRFDVERFVRAGPDHVILSIDGVEQASYARFRKGGDVALALENARLLVEAKRRLGLSRPILIWRFFPFEHNVHEVDRVLELAAEIGLDAVIIGTPFDVSNDDPGVRVAPCARRGRYDLTSPEERTKRPERIFQLLRRHEEVGRFFAEGWRARLAESDDEPARPDSPACLWLYHSMTADAVGRVMPCCIAPTVRKNLVFGDLADASSEPHNLEGFRLARLAFADRARFERVRDGLPDPRIPWCASCPKQPPLTYSPEAAISDLHGLDFEGVVFGRDSEFWWKLSRWE